MMKRLFRTLRRHLPPLWLIITFLGCYGLVWGLAEGFRHVLSSLDAESIVTLLKPFLMLEMMVATFGAAAFAYWRIYALHPLTNQEYRQWLERVPWTPDRPLPMGSVLPGLVDVAVLAILCWMAGRVLPISPLAPILGYLILSTLAVCIIAGFTRQRAILYILLFTLGLCIRTAANPFLPLLILAVTFPIALVGLRRSLEPARWPKFALSTRALSERTTPASKELGWPFGFLGPKASDRLIRWPDTLAVALLIGWFLHALLAHVDCSNADNQEVALGGAGMLAVGALIRAVGYTMWHSAPISLLGRICTGRWIIPQYDRVFVAPLLAAIAALLGEALVIRSGIPPALGQPAILSMYVFLLVAIGPSYRQWQLTGAHRINPSNLRGKAATYLEV